MTGDTFTGDKTPLEDVIGNLYLAIHEAVEINELKRAGLSIDTGTVVTAPKDTVYHSHFAVMDRELEVALGRGDADWVRIRISHHYRVLTDDEFLPDCRKGDAEAVYEKYRAYHVEGAGAA